jgi:short subunit dehydrogenase-like uncharacterized protein
MNGTQSPQSARRRERSRKFDLVLFGATGFTGKLVAEYIARNHAGSGLRWALAGRNAEKLARVQRELSALAPAGFVPEILLGDSTDRASLEEIARKTGVVCTTVGPYALYGSELVAACAAQGTDYCDLTGEPHWIRRMIDRHDTAARQSGARIVNCCGFDSVPSDLGTFMLEREALERFGEPCREVKYLLTRMRGGASGGTIASVLNVVKEATSDRAVRAVLADPYSLNPEGERTGPDRRDQVGVAREADLPGFSAPFMMAGINTRIVRRTNALLGYRYGRDFRYSEVMAFPSNAAGLSRAVQTTIGFGAFMLALGIPPVRTLLERRVLPKPGAGPSEEKRRRGSFEVTLIGKGQRGGTPFTLRGRVVGRSDPGYGETAKMLSESALCLAFDGPELDSPGGMLTPASAFGFRLVERLRRAGMTFAID